MSRKKEMDGLSRAATMAIAEGMSYGQWMAIHSGELKEKATAEKPAVKFVCQCCGNEFVRHDERKRKYCGDECRMRAADLRELEKYHKKQKKVNN